MKAATLLIEGIVKGILFQSTPPVKAATVCHRQSAQRPPISIHAAREGGDEAWQELCERAEISIHAAREGGDMSEYRGSSEPVNFNPRRP